MLKSKAVFLLLFLPEDIMAEVPGFAAKENVTDLKHKINP